MPVAKKTHEQFVAELACKNPTVEAIGQYAGSGERILVRCKICGNEWSPTASNLLQGYACQKCARKLNANKLRKTKQSYSKELRQLESTVELIGEYVNANTYTRFRCSKCGHEWDARPQVVLNHPVCPECSSRKRFKTHERFLEEFEKQHLEIKILGEYESSETPIPVRCLKCGHEWSPAPHSLLKGHGCPLCGRIESAKKHEKSHEEFVAELEAINPALQVIGVYKASNKGIRIACKKCGYEWLPTPRSLLKGTGCPMCNQIRKTKTHQAFVKELGDANPSLEVIGTYVNKRTKVKVRCCQCGHEWMIDPQAALRGGGCPRCVQSGTSFIEQAIYKALMLRFGEGKVFSRNQEAVGSELDVYVPDFEFAIEYGAWYWHKTRLQRDIEKERLCHSKGIKLYTIYDSVDEEVDFEGFNPILVPFSLAEEDGYITTKSIIEAILCKQGFPRALSKQDWAEVFEYARMHSGLKDTASFISELETINPTIEVLSQYSGALSRIRVRCKKCGHEWEPIASNLLQGTGCPECGRASSASKHKKTQEEFVSELSKTNPAIQVIGQYVGSNKRVRSRCLRCGHEWEPIAANLLQGRGCPECGKRIAAEKNRKTHEQFVAELKEKHPSIRVLGQYAGLRNSILVECMNCGYEWNIKALSLIRGKGCPICCGKEPLD